MPRKTKSLAITKLNPNQRMFCELYAGGGEYFGNAVWSYILAFKLTDSVPLKRFSDLNEQQQRDYNSAKVQASVLLTNHNVKNKCNELVDSLIKDEIVDRELVKVILQMDELAPKVSAIKEYNVLKKRVSDVPNLPPPELHLHLHKNEKVVQIIKEAEEKLLKELRDEIQND